MNVYIVTESPCALVESETLKIMQVREQDEASFLKEYAGCILVAGNSIQDVLMKLSPEMNN